MRSTRRRARWSRRQCCMRLLVPSGDRNHVLRRPPLPAWRLISSCQPHSSRQGRTPAETRNYRSFAWPQPGTFTRPLTVDPRRCAGDVDRSGRTRPHDRSRGTRSGGRPSVDGSLLAGHCCRRAGYRPAHRLVTVAGDAAAEGAGIEWRGRLDVPTGLGSACRGTAIWVELVDADGCTGQMEWALWVCGLQRSRFLPEHCLGTAWVHTRPQSTIRSIGRRGRDLQLHHNGQVALWRCNQRANVTNCCAEASD
jgi:hypothetical protein